jgi:hypothetical protein
MRCIIALRSAGGSGHSDRAGFLGMVEREVGILTQDDAVQPILTGKRPADGDAGDAWPSWSSGTATAASAAEARARMGRPRNRGQDGELVAADPAGQAIGERRAEPHADLGDQRVPGSMASVSLTRLRWSMSISISP